MSVDIGLATVVEVVSTKNGLAAVGYRSVPELQYERRAEVVQVLNALDEAGLKSLLYMAQPCVAFLCLLENYTYSKGTESVSSHCRLLRIAPTVISLQHIPTTMRRRNIIIHIETLSE